VLLTGHLSRSNLDLEKLRKQIISAPSGHPPEVREDVKTERKPQPRLTPDQQRKLVEAYADGATLRTLSRQFGIHEQTVKAHVRRAGLALRRPHALSHEQAKEALKLHQGGMSKRALARRFGVSYTGLDNALKRARRRRDADEA
jgi:DNA-directed RNA polymerase specialized sigma24 family protein